MTGSQLRPGSVHAPSFFPLVLCSCCGAASARLRKLRSCAYLCGSASDSGAARMHSVQSIPIGGLGFFVPPGKDAEDAFAAEDLTKKAWQEPGCTRMRRSFAWSGRIRSLQESAERHNLSFDPAMHDEGYVIVPDGQGGLAVMAETSAGIFYGAQTVKQLIPARAKICAAGADSSRLAGDGAPRTVGRLVARADPEHGFFRREFGRWLRTSSIHFLLTLSTRLPMRARRSPRFPADR